MSPGGGSGGVITQRSLSPQLADGHVLRRVVRRRPADHPGPGQRPPRGPPPVLPAAAAALVRGLDTPPRLALRLPVLVAAGPGRGCARFRWRILCRRLVPPRLRERWGSRECSRGGSLGSGHVRVRSPASPYDCRHDSTRPMNARISSRSSGSPSGSRRGIRRTDPGGEVPGVPGRVPDGPPGVDGGDAGEGPADERADADGAAQARGPAAGQGVGAQPPGPGRRRRSRGRCSRRTAVRRRFPHQHSPFSAQSRRHASSTAISRSGRTPQTIALTALAGQTRRERVTRPHSFQRRRSLMTHRRPAASRPLRVHLHRCHRPARRRR